MIATENLRLARAVAQGLAGPRPNATAAEILRHIVGAQAQVFSAAALSIRARSRGLGADEIVAAAEGERSIVRGWVMRGTLHLVAAEDYAWLVALLGPLFDRPSKRRADLGLDPGRMDQGLDAVKSILGSHGPMTRAEIVEALARKDLVLDPRSQAPAHLLLHCGLNGLICEGPRRGSDVTWVLATDWLGQPPPAPGDPWAELVRRYLAAYGPAGPQDLAAWSGVSLGVARRAFAAAGPDIEEVATDIGSLWRLKGSRVSPESAPDASLAVRLLPEFDTYLFGYRRRDFAFSQTLESHLQRGGGWVHRSVVAEGRGVGAWSLERKGKQGGITVRPFEVIADAERAVLQAEAEDVGRFLGIGVALTYETGEN